MKPSAFLINVARGKVVDEPALLDALGQGRIAGAGLDCTVEEPLPANSPLWDVPNVFVVGASAFPQNGGYNPTGTVGALTFHAVQAIKTRYLKKPGLLA